MKLQTLVPLAAAAAALSTGGCVIRSQSVRCSDDCCARAVVIHRMPMQGMQMHGAPMPGGGGAWIATQTGDDGAIWLSDVWQDMRAAEENEPGESFEEMAALSNGAFLGVTTSLENDRVKVSHVLPDSPAAAAGLKEGDVVREIGDVKVQTPADVTKVVQSRKPGEKVGIEVERDGKPTELHATLGITHTMAFGDATRSRTVVHTQPLPMGGAPVPMGRARAGTPGMPPGGAEMKKQMDELQNEVRELRELIEKLVAEKAKK